MDRESTARSELYRCRPPARLKIPISVHLTESNNEVPPEADFDMAVQGLRAGIAGGPSGMMAEDLKEWSKEDKREKEPVGRKREMMVWLL